MPIRRCDPLCDPLNRIPADGCFTSAEASAGVRDETVLEAIDGAEVRQIVPPCFAIVKHFYVIPGKFRLSFFMYVIFD